MRRALRRVELACLPLLLAALALHAVEAEPLRPSVKASIAKGEVDRALAMAREGVEQRPGEAQAWADLAAARYRAADFEGCEVAAEKALGLDEKNADARVARARARFTRGAGAAAVEDLRRAHEFEPRHALALRLLAGGADFNADRARVRELAGEFLKLDAPKDDLFANHLRQGLALLDALGEEPVNVYPLREQVPERLSLPMRNLPGGPSIELKGPAGARVTFLLDTGEESLTLRAETARRLGAKLLSEMPAATATGIASMKQALVPSLAAGEWTVRNVLASIGSQDIVGPAFFEGFRVKLDFPKGEAVLARQDPGAAPNADDLARAPEGFRRFRFRRLGGLVCVPLASPGLTSPPERPAWGVLDTGCEPTCVLFPGYVGGLKAAHGRPPLALPIPGGLGGAAAGSGGGDARVLPEFQLAWLQQIQDASPALCSASVASINKVLEVELAGVIGWPLIGRAFRSIEIDFERCVLTVEPRARR
ncbi:MAG: retroviral-like aspartic protease family protein [Planctomycetota bacterium]|nr:retroviral-like aspartic protease family protein [Planctomycetota bacterium]